jgi:hypothetical protein
VVLDGAEALVVLALEVKEIMERPEAVEAEALVEKEIGLLALAEMALLHQLAALQ